MKTEVEVKTQITVFKAKQTEIASQIRIAEAMQDNDELLILEMQLAEVKGILKALEWTVK